MVFFHYYSFSIFTLEKLVFDFYIFCLHLVGVLASNLKAKVINLISDGSFVFESKVDFQLSSQVSIASFRTDFGR